MWVSVLWKVLGCFTHDAKYQDDSWEKKRLSNICPFGLYDAKHWDIWKHWNAWHCNDKLSGWTIMWIFFLIPYFGAAYIIFEKSLYYM